MGKTVLLVDDSDMIRIYLSSLLSNEGYKVILATNGKDALKKLAETSVKADVIITDLNMPVMNGLELIRHLRGTDSHQTVPILIITGNPQDSKINQAEKAGISDCIEKPVSPDRLKNALSNLTKQLS